MTKKKKLKYLSFILLIGYILFCQSCFTMRYSKKETKRFFSESATTYIDSTITINKSKIHYIETGTKNKPVLIFVHGSPGSWNAFENYLKDSELISNYRMIAVDRPGFGFSNFRRAKNLEEQSELLNTFIKQLTSTSENNIALVGHSYGGPLIVKMAIDAPKAYSHLYVLAGALDPAAEKPEKWRPIIEAIPLRFLVPGALHPSNKELWYLKDDLHLLRPQLKELSIPVTIIHGIEDKLVPYINVAFMEAEFSNAPLKIETLKGANHFIPWTHYAIVKRELMSFKW